MFPTHFIGFHFKVFYDLENKLANVNIYFSDLQCNIFVHVEVYTCAVCTPVRGCVYISPCLPTI